MLVGRGLAEDNEHVGANITAAGRALITDEAEASPTERVAQVEPSPAPASKIARVVHLLCRDEGATLNELVAATGWLPHTTRAALTGLRRKGHVLDKALRGGATCYRIAEA